MTVRWSVTSKCKRLLSSWKKVWIFRLQDFFKVDAITPKFEKLKTEKSVSLCVD